MNNILTSTTKLAFHMVSKYLVGDFTAVDCTCGNGHDTLALLDAGAKHIFAFDIQNEAINSTVNLLNSSGLLWHDKVTLINDSHENIKKYVDKTDVIFFNLGYLPSGDKSITTNAASTIKAVSSALDILNKNGVCCIVMYDGHKNGQEEKKQLLNLAENLNSSVFHTAYVKMINQHNNPPEILLITRKKEDNHENKKR